MRSGVGVVLVLALCAAPAAHAAVLCKKKNGAVMLRDTACAKKETAVDLAAIGATGPKGDKGDQGDAGAPATALWAVVASDGTLVRGSHVTSSTSLSILRGGPIQPTILPQSFSYEVLFDRDVSACAYTISLGNQSSGLPIGEVATQPRDGNANGVYVETYDSSGAGSARGFHLAVFCP